MRNHATQWVTPAPLWREATPEPDRMQRPAVLRFDGDEFMDDLFALLGSDPRALGGRALPAGGAKLFQPTHGRFYLVAASLVCRLPGLPDRAADPAADKVGFVVRRWTDGRQEAWVTGADGTKAWAEGRERVEGGEEVFPMFPASCELEDRRRRLFFGLIPTSSREAFVSTEPIPASDDPYDPDMERYDDQVLGPVKALAKEHIPEDVQKEVSRYVLLDLSELLKEAQPDPLAAPPGPGDQSHPLFVTLATTPLAGTSWLASLQVARAAGDASAPDVNLRSPAARTAVATFRPLFLAALKPLAERLPTTVPEPVPKLDAPGQLYVVRCVYQRPACKGLHPDVLSKPTAPFEIAGFYDPDAPARPIRIVMPDTSLAGLRKAAKKVAFVTGANLRKQLSRVPGLEGLSKGELKDESDFSLGEICSFSIPIITICAFVLLLVIVIALNIVFWWLPFFRLCFPIPRKG